MADLSQEKIDLAKKILFAELLKKQEVCYTKTESEIFFWLSADPAIREVLARIDSPANPGTERK
jgi:hypothetical protein